MTADPAPHEDRRPAPPPGYCYLWASPEDVPYTHDLQRREGFLERLLRCETCGAAGLCVVYDKHPVWKAPWYVGDGPLSTSYHETSPPHTRGVRLGRGFAEGQIPVWGFVQAALTRHKVPFAEHGLRPSSHTDYYNTIPIRWVPRANVEEIATMGAYHRNRTGDTLRCLLAVSESVRAHGIPWWQEVARGLGEEFDPTLFVRGSRGPYGGVFGARYRGGAWPLSVRVDRTWPWWLQHG